MITEEQRKLLELNQGKIAVEQSRAFFLGARLERYLSYLKGFHPIRFAKLFFHDLGSVKKKKSFQYSLIDITQGFVEPTDRIAVYTSIYGAYDPIPEPMTKDVNCDYFIFTDQEVPSSSVWKKADDSLIPDECNTPALKNRYVKMHPHLLFKNRFSIYLDGNLRIVGGVSNLVQHGAVNSKTGIAMHLSPREVDIYSEAKNAFFRGKITKKELRSIIRFYKQEGMPHNFGMFECNVIVRDSKNQNNIQLMDEWWERYKNGVKRDQLYFTFVLFKQRFSFSDVFNFGASVNSNPIFIRTEHLQNRGEKK